MPDVVKIERFKKALMQSDIDVVVATTPENTWYLSEVVIDTQRTILERLAVVVWAKHADPVYIVCTNEEIQVRKESWIKDIRGYVEYQKSPMDLTADAIRELGAAKGRIGIELKFLTAHYFAQLQKLLPEATFVEVGPFFDRVRMIKTAAEIARLEAAAMATDRAMRTAFEQARPGMTEKQVGVILSSELIKNGAEMQAFQVLAAGESTILTHPRATDYVIQNGDLMRTDFGGMFPGGYLSDLGRTICVGRPNQRQIDTYRQIWEEHERLISMLRPGLHPRELYMSHKQQWDAKGWAMKRPHIGHSLGIGLHEHPLLMPSEELTLEAGMCMAIEPTHIWPGVEKFHTEDLVLITETGYRVLSRSADWSLLLTPGA
jgi:Xaa-Pro aminopeptidase